MQLSLQKVRLRTSKGEVSPKEENMKLKRDLEATTAERERSSAEANQLLGERNAALRIVDFQKTKIERQGEEAREL